MNQIEVGIAIWTLIISTVFNILSVIYNVYSIKSAQKERKKLENYSNKREAIIKYYLPIKYKLLQLECCEIKIKEQMKDFNIFNSYSNNAIGRKLREELLQGYKIYIDFYNSIEVRYADSTLDCKLNYLYSHMQFILTMGDEKNIGRYRDKYIKPNLSEIIDEIERFALENKVFE